MSTISNTGTFTVNVSGQIPFNTTVNAITMTGSHFSYNDPTVPTAWTALYTASLANVRYLVADNLGQYPIAIATGSAGQNVLSVLMPGDVIMLPWSGALSLYAEAQGSASQLSYLAVEA